MVDEELRAPAKEIRQGSAPLVGVELVFFVDLYPGQLLAPLREFVATPRELLLRLEEVESCGELLAARAGHVRDRLRRHRSDLPC